MSNTHFCEDAVDFREELAIVRIGRCPICGKDREWEFSTLEPISRNPLSAAWKQSAKKWRRMYKMASRRHDKYMEAFRLAGVGMMVSALPDGNDRVTIKVPGEELRAAIEADAYQRGVDAERARVDSMLTQQEAEDMARINAREIARAALFFLDKISPSGYHVEEARKVLLAAYEAGKPPRRKRRPTYIDEEGNRRTDYSQEPR